MSNFFRNAIIDQISFEHFYSLHAFPKPIYGNHFSGNIRTPCKKETKLDLTPEIFADTCNQVSVTRKQDRFVSSEVRFKK